jgi:hypothetical protein
VRTPEGNPERSGGLDRRGCDRPGVWQGATRRYRRDRGEGSDANPQPWPEDNALDPVCLNEVPPTGAVGPLSGVDAGFEPGRRVTGLRDAARGWRASSGAGVLSDRVRAGGVADFVYWPR